MIPSKQVIKYVSLIWALFCILHKKETSWNSGWLKKTWWLIRVVGAAWWGNCAWTRCHPLALLMSCCNSWSYKLRHKGYIVHSIWHLKPFSSVGQCQPSLKNAPWKVVSCWFKKAHPQFLKILRWEFKCENTFRSSHLQIFPGRFGRSAERLLERLPYGLVPHNRGSFFVQTCFLFSNQSQDFFHPS